MIYEGESSAFIVSFFSIPFFWSVIGILWKPVTSIINKTSITVDDKAISISKPFLPTNNFAIRLSKLKAIFSEVRKESDDQKITIYHWQVYARTYNNNDKKLIETNKREQMLFIEKTLKDYLNIKSDLQE